MEFFANYYYGLLRRLLLMAGGWPYHDTYISRLRRTVIVSYMTFAAASQLLAICMRNYNLNLVLDIVPTIAITAICIVKLVTVSANLALKLRNLLDWIERDWQTFKTKDERQILQEYANKTRIFGKVYTLIFEVSFVVIVSLQFLPYTLDVIMPLNYSRPRYPMMNMELFIDQDKYRYSIMLYTLVGMIFGCITACAVDMTFVACAWHACAICKIVRIGFEKVFWGIGTHVCTNNKDCEYHRRFKKCIGRHKMLIGYVDLFNSCFTNGIGLQVSIAIFGYTFMNLNVSLISVTSEDTDLRFSDTQLVRAIKLLRDVQQIIMLLVIIFGYNIALVSGLPASQRLIDYSYDLSSKIYCTRWYAACSQVQKMIVFILIKTQKPLCIYIGNYLTISSETCLRVCQMSLSYFMAAYNLYGEEV